MKIGDWDLDRNILVIGEIGNNHEGSYVLAEEMIGLAARAGAGAVKFQTIVPNRLVAPSQKERIKQLEKFQLCYDDFEKLRKVAEREKVLFLSTPFDIESAHFLDKLVPAFKISSGDNNFFPLLNVVAQTGKPILLSSGLADMRQITITRDFIQRIWHERGINQELAVLHCVASYPTPPQEVNLLAIKELKDRLGVTVGYSDHTLGIEAAVVSAVLGAHIIEKHFTISKNHSDFRDHRLSADPQDMALLVQRVNEISELLGTGDKVLQPSEKAMESLLRRSIVAKRDLPRDTTICWDDITWTRPADGLAPGKEHLVLGKSLSKQVKMGEPLVPEILYEKNDTSKLS